jgi:hypothetical protein
MGNGASSGKRPDNAGFRQLVVAPAPQFHFVARFPDLAAILATVIGDA